MQNNRSSYQKFIFRDKPEQTNLKAQRSTRRRAPNYIDISSNLIRISAFGADDTRICKRVWSMTAAFIHLPEYILTVIPGVTPAVDFASFCPWISFMLVTMGTPLPLEPGKALKPSLTDSQGLRELYGVGGGGRRACGTSRCRASYGDGGGNGTGAQLNNVAVDYRESTIEAAPRKRGWSKVSADQRGLRLGLAVE